MQNTACNFSGNQYNYYCCLIDNNKIAMPQWRNWQTRNVQVVVWVSMYRFESCLGHFLCFLCFYTIAKRWYKSIFIFHETLKNVFNTHFAEKVRKNWITFFPAWAACLGGFYFTCGKECGKNIPQLLPVCFRVSELSAWCYIQRKNNGRWGNREFNHQPGHHNPLEFSAHAIRKTDWGLF